MQYLNTDLDIVSAQDLSPLAAALEIRGLLTLHADRREDGLWYATFETGETFQEPEPNIAGFLDVIEALDEDVHRDWRTCQTRELNMGYECGTGPWEFKQAIPATILARVAAAGMALRITLYPGGPLA